MTPKVTILLAVHDGERYIGRSVGSVLTQTFSDFELLVVDDASSDATVDVVRSFGDERVRLIHNDENLGQVPSLNRGLREAQGTYVARLDADDWCMPTRLERQVETLDADERVGLVGTWIDLVDEDGRRLGSQRERLDDYLSFVYATLIMKVYVSHPASMYRRGQVVELGGYDESTGPSEDKDLWRRMLLAGLDARIVPETLLAYRIHAGQLSHRRYSYQREVDRQSQLRFLEVLAPGVPSRALMLLLAGDPEYWREDARAALAAVDPVLAGAAARLSLDDGDAAALEGMIAARIVEMAGRRPWRRGSRALVSAGLGRLEGVERRTAALAAARAPARELLRVAGKADALSAIRARAGRVWILRRLYGKLVGSA